MEDHELLAQLPPAFMVEFQQALDVALRSSTLQTVGPVHVTSLHVEALARMANENFRTIAFSLAAGEKRSDGSRTVTITPFEQPGSS